MSCSIIYYLYFIFSVERKKRISSTKSGDMLDHRLAMTRSVALKERSTFADVTDAVKSCCGTFDKFGKELAIAFHKPNISSVFVS